MVTDISLRTAVSRRAALGAASVAGGVLTSGVASAAQSRNATAETAAAALDRAIVARDIAALDALIAPDFLWVRGGGARADKAAFIAGLAAPGISIEPFTPSDVRWLKSGELAVLSGINELRGSEGGAAFVDRHSFCDIFRRDRQGWRLVYAQITRAPQDE